MDTLDVVNRRFAPAVFAGWQKTAGMLSRAKDADARIMLIGEAPGITKTSRGVRSWAQRAISGEPAKGIGLSRSEVYICNVIKCRPQKTAPFLTNSRFAARFLSGS